MLKEIKKEVFQANMSLAEYKLVIFTWGNVSAIDRNQGLVVIKPSGIDYREMKPERMVVLDMNGTVVEGDLKPSSDAPTHLCLYKEFPEIGGVVHTHSEWATIWAQAGKGIPALGTTHADYFKGEIPSTRSLTRAEIEGDYETETGRVIVETFRDIKYQDIPGVLVSGHGPFCWGNSAADAVHNAVVLEQVARMAYHTLRLNEDATINPGLLEKHFSRKHGPDAYYGQKKKEK
jgi:L-ribulose-5-phosphate 4-epimerase